MNLGGYRINQASDLLPKFPFTNIYNYNDVQFTETKINYKLY